SLVVLLPYRSMDGEIGCAWRTFESHPLIAEANLHVSIILNSRECGIENIIVEDVLCVVRTLLCARVSHRENCNYHKCCSHTHFLNGLCRQTLSLACGHSWGR